MSGHVFHPGHHELHGITVVVRTTGDTTYVGRFDREDGDAAYLKDVGIHRGGSETWREYFERARLYGIKVDQPNATVARSDIADIQPFNDVRVS